MSTAVEPKTCRTCGQPLGGLAPAGVCPRCLLMTGLGDTNPGTAKEPDPTGVEVPRDSVLPRPFGDYELFEEIARGGMGIVYKARQRSLDRIVAVKMLLFGQYTSAEFIHRFRIEATAAASLQHPNIVAVHEVGLHQGQHYFAMEFVDGPNLAQFVRDKPLPATRAAAYVQAIAEAIEFAHQRCVLHRDLKPSNVLIGSNDQPRVTDFGLAKRFGVAPSTSSTGGARGEAATPNWDLTVTGQMLGSPNYMPPEQASVQRGKIGPHSDVYSLGAILYYALTARPPFLGETVADTLQQVLHSDPVAPHLLNPAVPADLETICLKCLERETAKRYATAQDLADELSRFLRGEPILARPVTRRERAWRWCRRNPALAAVSAIAWVFLVILAIGSPLVAFRINQARKAEVVQRELAKTQTELARAEALRARQNQYAGDMIAAQRAVEEGNLGRAQQLLEEHIPAAQETDQRGFEWRFLWGLLRGDFLGILAKGATENRYLSTSPDGHLLANGSRLWDVNTGAVVTDLGNHCTVLGFGPRGQTVLFRRGENGDAFVRRNLITGEEATLLDHEPVAALSGSKSGRWLATGSSQGLRLWDTTTWQVARSVTNAPFDHWPSLRSDARAFNWFSAKGLAFSPDDKLLIVVSGYALGHQSELSAWTIPALQPVPMPSTAVEDAACVTFSPDGREFVTGHWEGDLRFWDSASLTEIKSCRLPNAHRSWIGDMQFLPGTRKLVTVGADRCIHIWDTEPRGEPVTLRGHFEEVASMAITPDGMIYTVASERIKQWSPERLISREEGVVTFPSPCLPAGICEDGKLLATISDKALQFWRIREPKVTEDRSLRVELREEGKLPLNWRKMEGEAAVSPDRRWLAIGRPKERIRIRDLAGIEPVRLLDGGSAPYQYVGFSPDSQLLIACQTLESFAIFDTTTWQNVAVIPTPGKEDTDFPFHFAERANVLAVEGAQSVLLWDTAKRRMTREIFSDKHKMLLGCAISPDGQMIAVGYQDDTFSLHECATGRQIATVPSHVSGVEWLAFSPDGKTLATASGHWVKLWNLATLREMFPVELSSLAVFVGFLPDANGLLTADVAGNTRLLRARPFDRVSADRLGKSP